jgi:ketosteroid isomerase-like protein
MAFQTTDARLQRVADFFEALSPADLDRIGTCYTPTACFKDPFNEVQGLPAIRAVFAHMYVALNEPRFVVTGGVVQGNEAFLTWDFVFRFKRFDRATVQTVRGASQLRFAPDGRIELHRDYWDAAEELYEKLPVLGALMRWPKRRARG